LNLYLAYFAVRGTDGKLFGAAVVGAFYGVYLFYRGFQILQRKRLIQNTPTSTVRGAALGLVEVNGLAAGPHTIPSAIGGIPCYYYRSLAWQLKRTGKNEHWEKVADESLHVPFYIDDNTGTVLVDPQGAELDLHRDFQEQYSNSLFSASTAVPPNVAAFLGRHGIDFCDKKTKVEEFCIKPKNCLFVLGTLSQNHGVSVSSIPVRTIVAESSASSLSASSIPYYSRNSQAVRAQRNKQSGEVIRLQGGDKPGESASMTQQEKVASALLRAGINNPAAWAVAGTIDPTSTSHASLATKAVTVTGIGGGTAVQTAPETFDREPATVLMKGERNPAFYISWRSQRTVVRSLGWKSGLMIWGGPALTLLCLYILSAYFRLF
jgi:hypothetical protein